MKRILVLGSGGRENAIAWKLAQHLGESQVFVLPGNGGSGNRVSLESTDFSAIKEFCRRERISWIFPGSESFLAKGIVDALHGADGLQVLGPDQGASRLESSKTWAKDFMKRHGVKTARYAATQGAREAVREVNRWHNGVVIKYDGLAGGKGVRVCRDRLSAREAVDTLGSAHGDSLKLVFEEILEGEELSLIGFTDGKTCRLLLPVQDHKQLLDNDQGPNTGGMGVFGPVPFCDQALLERIQHDIIQPTLHGMQEEKLVYRGPIYFGLMITNSGPMLLEYNARLGDPETQILLPSLKNDLTEIMAACLDGTLDKVTMEYEKGFFVGVILAAGNYPEGNAKGDLITGLDQVSSDIRIFHNGTEKTARGIETNGGRILTVVARGENLPQARETVYKACDMIQFTGKQFRRDIGARRGPTTPGKA